MAFTDPVAEVFKGLLALVDQGVSFSPSPSHGNMGCILSGGRIPHS
jgi:hypothetical protein